MISDEDNPPFGNPDDPYLDMQVADTILRGQFIQYTFESCDHVLICMRSCSRGFLHDHRRAISVNHQNHGKLKIIFFTAFHYEEDSSSLSRALNITIMSQQSYTKIIVHLISFSTLFGPS